MHHRHFFWVIGLCAAPGRPAGANDSALLRSGGLAAPMEEQPSIHMVSAEITVDLYNGHSRVQCDYLFRNEGPATTVTMGFPSLPGYGDIVEQQVAPELEQFYTWVDGQEVGTRQVREARTGETAGRRWYTKQVAFAAGQERRVRDAYRQPNGRVAGGPQFLPYALSTGASWHGPIGNVQVRAQWRETWEWTPYPHHTEGPAWVSQPDFRELRWQATDLEPDFDLRLDFAPGWQQVSIDGYHVHYWGLDVRVLPEEVYVSAVTLAELLTATLTYNARRHEAQFKLSRGRQYMARAGHRPVLDGTPLGPEGGAVPYEEDGVMWVPLTELLSALGWKMTPVYPDCRLEVLTGRPVVWQAQVQGPEWRAPWDIYLAREQGLLLGEIRPLIEVIEGLEGQMMAPNATAPVLDYQLTLGARDFRFSWDRTRAWCGGRFLELPVAPYISASRSGMAPVEALCEALGLQCEYDEAKKLLTVSEK